MVDLSGPEGDENPKVIVPKVVMVYTLPICVFIVIFHVDIGLVVGDIRSIAIFTVWTTMGAFRPLWHPASSHRVDVNLPSFPVAGMSIIRLGCSFKFKW